MRCNKPWTYLIVDSMCIIDFHFYRFMWNYERVRKETFVVDVDSDGKKQQANCFHEIQSSLISGYYKEMFHIADFWSNLTTKFVPDLYQNNAWSYQWKWNQSLKFDSINSTSVNIICKMLRLKTNRDLMTLPKWTI